jgi:hypothetical protein
MGTLLYCYQQTNRTQAAKRKANLKSKNKWNTHSGQQKKTKWWKVCHTEFLLFTCSRNELNATEHPSTTNLHPSNSTKPNQPPTYLPRLFRVGTMRWKEYVCEFRAGVLKSSTLHAKLSAVSKQNRANINAPWHPHKSSHSNTSSTLATTCKDMHLVSS